MMYTPHNSTITADEFIKREIRIWGEEYTESLLDNGYTPYLTVTNSGTKWVWLLTAQPVHAGN